MTASKEKLSSTKSASGGKEKISGWTATLLFHLLLLLLFFLLKLPAQAPSFGNEETEEGILIDFGDAETGMGQEFTPQENQTTTNPESQSKENILIQNTEPTIPVISKTETQTKQSETQLRPDPSLLSATNKLTSSSTKSGEGNTSGENNEGNPFGTVGENLYSEGKEGGHAWKLKGSGRKMIGKIEIDDQSQETGIVAVEIVVDKNGKIIQANPVLLGSTTTNQYLWGKAKEGLLNKTLYNASSSGQEARGLIHINFTVK